MTSYDIKKKHPTGSDSPARPCWKLSVFAIFGQDSFAALATIAAVPPHAVAAVAASQRG